MSCVGHSKPHQQSRIRSDGALVAGILPRCKALEMQISCSFPSDCSTSWMDHLFGPRYSDTAEIHVVEWSWKCRIIAASLVWPFPRDEAMVGGVSPSSWKLRCIDWWSAKVSLNLRFGQKPAARWWNFGGGGAPFLHFRQRRRHNYSGGGGATGVGL